MQYTYLETRPDRCGGELTIKGTRIRIAQVITMRFLSPFGDMTLWNILVSCIVLPYIYPYSSMTKRMLWGHILSVVPETSSMAEGARFRLNTGHHRPDPLVTGCHAPAP